MGGILVARLAPVHATVRPLSSIHGQSADAKGCSVFRPALRLGRELEPVDTDVDDAVDGNEPPRVLAGPAADAGDKRVALHEAAHLGARLLRHLRELGPGDDRSEGPVDVEKDGR